MSIKQIVVDTEFQPRGVSTKINPYTLGLDPIVGSPVEMDSDGDYYYPDDDEDVVLDDDVVVSKVCSYNAVECGVLRLASYTSPHGRLSLSRIYRSFLC